MGAPQSLFLDKGGVNGWLGSWGLTGFGGGLSIALREKEATTATGTRTNDKQERKKNPRDK